MAFEINRPIQHKRGLKADLPTLSAGEFGFCTDTGELYIGSADGNVLVNTSLSDTSDLAGLDPANPYSLFMALPASTNEVYKKWVFGANDFPTYNIDDLITDIQGFATTEIENRTGIQDGIYNLQAEIEIFYDASASHTKRYMILTVSGASNDDDRFIKLVCEVDSINGEEQWRMITPQQTIFDDVMTFNKKIVSTNEETEQTLKNLFTSFGPFDITFFSAVTIGGTEYYEITDVFDRTETYIDGEKRVILTLKSGFSYWNSCIELYLTWGEIDMSFGDAQFSISSNYWLGLMQAVNDDGDAYIENDGNDVLIEGGNYQYGIYLEVEFEDLNEIIFSTNDYGAVKTTPSLEFGEFAVQNAEESLIVSKNPVPVDVEDATLFTKENLTPFGDLTGKHIFGKIDFAGSLRNDFIVVAAHSNAYPQNEFVADFVLTGSAYSDTGKLRDAFDLALLKRKKVLIYGSEVDIYVNGEIDVKASVIGVSFKRQTGVTIRPTTGIIRSIFNVVTDGVIIEGIRFYENSNSYKCSEGMIRIDDFDNVTIKECWFEHRYTPSSIYILRATYLKILDNVFASATGSDPVDYPIYFNGSGLSNEQITINRNEFNTVIDAIRISKATNDCNISNNIFRNVRKMIDMTTAVGQRYIITGNIARAMGSCTVLINALLGKSVINNNVLEMYSYDAGESSIKINSGSNTGNNIITGNLLDHSAPVIDSGAVASTVANNHVIES